MNGAVVETHLLLRLRAGRSAGDRLPDDLRNVCSALPEGKEANMRRNMRDVKCEAAHEVIKALETVDVLYLDSFVLDQWRPWGTQFSDDLQVLVEDEQIDKLMAAMQAGGYVPFDRRGGRCRPLTREQAKRAVLKLPASPEPFYVHSSLAKETCEPDLLVRFHTTKRHGRLMLADLQGWFAAKGRSTVMVDTDYATKVDRPPLWGMMLWQAGEMMNHASDCAITKEEVDKLHAVAQHLAPGDWPSVLDSARQYSKEYDDRIKCRAASELLEDYRRGLGVNKADLQKAEREYGALYELSHAIRALVDYGGPYRDVVPADVREDLAQFTEERPRKLWGYAGGREDVPPPGARGMLGIAKPEFGIHAQIEKHPGADFDYLLRHGLVTRVIPNAPPHGPWAQCTARRMRSILA